MSAFDSSVATSRRPSTTTTPQSPTSPASHYLNNQPLPPLPSGSRTTSGGHHSRQPSGPNGRALYTNTEAYDPASSRSGYSTPVVIQSGGGGDSPILPSDDDGQGEDIGEPSPAQSQHHLPNSHSHTSRKASASTTTFSSATDPRLLQHHPSQAGSLRNVSSQSSLAGLPTARSNRYASGEATPKSSRTRQASGQTVNGTSPNGADQSDPLKPNGTATQKPAQKAKEKEKEKEKSNPPMQKESHPRTKMRYTPHLPQYDAERVSAAVMHWSKAPVHGILPTRSMRAHTVTMVDHTAWIFGGCDERGCYKDVWCFDIETFQWSHPEMRGDIPPPCRAHTATLVDRKIYVFGGGEGPTYFNDLYVLDTVSHRWIKPNITSPVPLPRRAHTAVLFKDTIYIFGGGNGHRALNDVWALDVSVGLDKLQWRLVPTHGTKPGARGYHTANLVGEVMVVLGGSDGRECFADVWVLDLEKLVWREVRPEKTYRRLSHSSTQVGSYLFIMGGHDGVKYSHELLLFNLVTLQFEPKIAQGRPPSSRGYHVTTLADSRLWVFGGFDGHVVFDDVWLLDLAAAAYLPQVTSFGIYVE